ncbi:hypothetical protein GCM10007108_01070 [Thermogymnomonas acidicola]|uniref:Uncharacterized protein n=1 Tax=Thermogymnomonas acidicola TaxID=399579 RepID=A0AA37BPT5_9ARCH|nr:hypothetical protein [Thermogymnomonas acidicola]GGM66670.1 hypothetical protein GCM10007108_01070 [Thermogymnomonas acidicola]
MLTSYPDAWNTAIALALAMGSVKIPKDEFPCGPEESGMFERSVGEPHGQRSDWRCSIPSSGMGAHVRDFGTYYEVHIDRHDALRMPVRHFFLDSRTGKAVLAAGAITALALALRERKKMG